MISIDRYRNEVEYQIVLYYPFIYRISVMQKII